MKAQMSAHTLLAEKNLTKMHDIIYFGNDWYAENRTSSHHIAQQLSKNNTVLYVECPGLRSPNVSGRDFKKIIAKISNSLRKPRQISENLAVYTLFQIPFHRYALVRAINKILIRTSIKRLIRQRRLSSPLLWFVIPHLSTLPGTIPCKAVIYYCIDDYSALPDIDSESVAKMDEQMTRMADIVFIASDTLMEPKESLNERVYLNPHGVDFDHFNRVYTGKATIPEDVAHLRENLVVGFFGLIEEWIDLELVRFIAESHPKWHILMIGRVAVTSNPCRSLPNVHFIGRRDFQSLPGYAAVFSVGILPYKLNRQVINSNPIKLREYLAAGLPVVSVRFPQVEHYADVVSIADNYEDFVSKIATSFETDSEELRRKRVDSVKTHTWEYRVKKALEVVDDYLST